MDVDNIQDIIKRLPNPVNWLLLRLNLFPKYLYGKKYAKHKLEIKNAVAIDKRLIKNVNRFISTTPFYNEKYTKIERISEFNKQVKFIDKDVVLANFDAFFSSDYKKEDYLEGKTGGSTGFPLKIFMPKNRYAFELSVVHNFWHSVGWHYHTRGVIRNHKIDDNKIYDINPITKEIQFDAFRLDEAYCKQIYNVLKVNRIHFIQCYPSSAYLFCKICTALNLDLSFIKAFLTSSEPVLPFQKEFVEDKLGLTLFNFYGHSEKLIIAYQCPIEDVMHFEPTYGYAELIDEQGNNVTQEGAVGEIVGTTFNNFGMPFVRYKTGDAATYMGNGTCNCGHTGLTVSQIIGHRSKNLIYKHDNTYTSPTALNLFSKLYDYIDGIQYVQEKKGELIIKLIPNKKYSQDIENEFCNHIKSIMGAKSEIFIHKVNKIDSEKNGKYAPLISRLNNLK